MVYPGKTAVCAWTPAHHPTRSSTRAAARPRRRASQDAASGPADTVSLMAPNVPEMLEAHFGVPMCGAVLNALNYRLDAATIRFILGHAEDEGADHRSRVLADGRAGARRNGTLRRW